VSPVAAHAKASRSNFLLCNCWKLHPHLVCRIGTCRISTAHSCDVQAGRLARPPVPCHVTLPAACVPALALHCLLLMVTHLLPPWQATLCGDCLELSTGVQYSNSFRDGHVTCWERHQPPCNVCTQPGFPAVAVLAPMQCMHPWPEP
jgi:hypothetical protein